MDREQTIKAMRKARLRNEIFDSSFQRHHRLLLTYEGLFDGQQLDTVMAREIHDFLVVANYPMKLKILKLNLESLRDMVTNCDELAAIVAQSEFADMRD